MPRRAIAQLELVMITAVILPLAIGMWLIAVAICQYVFRGMSGILSLPVL